MGENSAAAGAPTTGRRRPYFFEDFQRHEQMPDATVARFAEDVPADILDLWRDDGLGIFDGGFLRVIDPSRYIDVFRQTYLGAPHGVPVFATAFGDLIYVDGATFVTVRYRHGTSAVLAASLSTFRLTLSSARTRSTKLVDRLYAAAVDELGVPHLDECFGFVPLLALGGPERADHLRLVGLREHLLLIASLAGPVP